MSIRSKAMSKAQFSPKLSFASMQSRLLQSRSANHSAPATVPPIVREVLRSPGQPLTHETRAFMQSRFGHDFSRVRVHTDAKAAESARAVNALAYTVGRDVVLGAGRYAPGTAGGKGLLAHELTHVLQQRHAAPSGSIALGKPDDRFEEEASNMARALQQGQPEIQAILNRTERQMLNRDGADEASGAPSGSGTVQDAGSCTPAGTGIPPSSANCSIYLANSWWLPIAYVNNATCACLTTPNSTTANCVRQFLQERLVATPRWLKTVARFQKDNDLPNIRAYPAYQAFVQSFLTPRIYRDHVDAYHNCCCPSGPAPYPSWIGVTTVPVQPCSLVGLSIRYFGSCHGTPGSW